MDRREYLFQRKNRCVGRILGELEKILDETSCMPDVRSIIKTRIAEYHEDVLSAMEFDQFNALGMKVRDDKNPAHN